MDANIQHDYSIFQPQCKDKPFFSFFFYRLLMVNLPPIQRCAAGGEFTLKVSVDIGRLRRPGVSVPTDKGKRGQDTVWFPTLNFEAFSISAILRILKLINAYKTHFVVNNSKSCYKMRKTLFFWFVQFHTVLEVYEPQTLV